MSGSDYPSERLRRWLSQTDADEVLDANEASDRAGLSSSEERELDLPLDAYEENDSRHSPSPSFFSVRGDSLIPEVQPNAEEDFQAKYRALDNHISDQESIPEEGSIFQESFLRPSNLYKQCLDGYRSFLLSISGSPEIPQCHGFNKMLEEYGRLKLWGDQTRALHPGVLGSLSYVLRDQKEVSETVQTTFQRMVGSLTSAIKAAEKPSIEELQKLENLDNDSDLDSISESEDSDLDEQWPHEEPLYIILRNIFDCIELLFQLSNLLRQQRFQDRYLHSSVHPNQPYGTIQDNEHVRLKVQMWRNDQRTEGRIPIIEGNSVELPWESGMEIPVSPEVMSQRKVSRARQESIDSDLFSRLAVANTRRREQFLYWETHPYSGDARARARKNGADGRSEKSQTIRTFSSIAKSAIYMDAMEPDTRATTYAPSMINDVAQPTIRVPEFALISAGRDTFECPLCHMILDSEPMQYRQNWKRHVFRDLRPYICTYQACATPYRMFATRYDWVYHESQLHRRQWNCQKCSAAFDSKEEFQGHLEQSHAGIWNGPQISILADMGEGPKSEASRSACRFCLRSMPLKRISNHVAGHLEELSLFALPKLDVDENQSLSDHDESKETEPSLSRLSTAVAAFPPEIVLAKAREVKAEEENVGEPATSTTPQLDEQVNLDTPLDRNQSVDTNMQQVDTSVPTEDDFGYTSPADLARHDLGLGRLDSTDQKPVKGILKQPTARFSEEENFVREGIALHKDEATKKGVSPGARWTKINRKIVSPEALTIGNERFEDRDDFVIVLRSLSKEEIQAYATATAQLRG
ncbi:putative C2H2-type domain-containing protein [Seiridium unicorne]|uniref:C2H2-type domain-containing protein n=1 Tax=Seiridium unicorne TaxID=138068 RepID=A0ABR2VDA6_9PEZI